MSERRQLGVVTLSDERPARSAEDQQRSDQALALLREEVAQLAALRAELATEGEHGAPAASPRLDALRARLEGASRLALRLGLVTPAEAREVWHEAARQGLQDTSRGGDA